LWILIGRSYKTLLTQLLMFRSQSLDISDLFNTFFTWLDLICLAESIFCLSKHGTILICKPEIPERTLMLGIIICCRLELV